MRSGIGIDNSVAAFDMVAVGRKRKRCGYVKKYNIQEKNSPNNNNHLN